MASTTQPVKVYTFLDTTTEIKYDLWSLAARLRVLMREHPTDTTLANLAGDLDRASDVFEQWQLEQEQARK